MTGELPGLLAFWDEQTDLVVAGNVTDEAAKWLVCSAGHVRSAAARGGLDETMATTVLACLKAAWPKRRTATFEGMEVPEGVPLSFVDLVEDMPPIDEERAGRVVCAIANWKEATPRIVQACQLLSLAADAFVDDGHPDFAVEASRLVWRAWNALPEGVRRDAEAAAVAPENQERNR